MVFYHTSANIKIIRNILLDYEAAREITPYEYMKMYIDKCPDTIEEPKLTWIAETFIGIQKHMPFLNEIALHLSEELSDEEQDYFKIVVQAIIFQLQPKDMNNIYKSLFNLSKQLISTFTGFLSNNEVLTYISEVAQSYYDANYITEKIIAPLFKWQPYISEMDHNYAEYVQKVAARKIKPLTVPVQPTMMNRKPKEVPQVPSQLTLPLTPPNTIYSKNRKMVTKSAIDRKLKSLHEKNKQNAAKLLNEAKTQNLHLARRYSRKLSYVDDKPIQFKSKPSKIVASPSVPIKDTLTNVKRINNRIQKTEEEELKWLQCMLVSCRNPHHYEELLENDRREREKERLYDIEKKHVMGQISYEEAILAKKKLLEHNKKKYEEFKKLKTAWDHAIEEWRKNQLQKSRTQIETTSMIELNILEAKNAIIEKNKEAAEILKKQNAERVAEAMRVKQAELEYKVNMIKQIKVLAMITKQSKVPKIIDLTETAGMGFLGEMSIAELQERLAAMKMDIKEKIDKKKSSILAKIDADKKKLEETKQYIKSFTEERTDLRKHTKMTKQPVVLEGECSKEINDLKKILEEKRKKRLKLNA